MANLSLRALLDAGAIGLRHELVEALPVPWHRRGDPAADYELEDAALIAAIQAALLLGQPLILAGEPGVGKTTLAPALARRLDLFFHAPVQVKLVTAGLDLFYAFDEVARFRDAFPLSQQASPHLAPQVGRGRGMREYVRFSSLGRAILWSAGADTMVATGSVSAREIMGDERDTRSLRLGDIFPHEFDRTRLNSDESSKKLDITQPIRSVVLLDELDKAPRDSPNDILGELEALTFRIQELDLEISANPHAWPIVVITSNSERPLPDAFLRRCVFHWIEFPTERLAAIVAARCAQEYKLKASDLLVTSAVDIFLEMRNRVENKKPATAELISFIISLFEFGFPINRRVPANDERVKALLGTLLKTRVDLQEGGTSINSKP